MGVFLPKIPWILLEIGEKNEILEELCMKRERETRKWGKEECLAAVKCDQRGERERELI